MNKKLRNAKLGVVLSVLTLFICVFGYFSLNNSAAWFSSNREVNSKGMEIRLNDPNEIVDGEIEYYKISKISLDDNRNNIYYFSSQKITDPTEIKLETLSYVVAERQILIKIPLKSTVSSVKLTTSTSEDYLLNALKEGEVFPDDTKIYPLSSVIEIRAISNLTVDENSLYVVESTNEKLTQPVRFLNDVVSTDGKYPFSKDLSLSLYATPTGQTDNAVFLLLDYYEESAELINSITLGTATVGEEENAIQFACDFTLIIE